MPDNKGIGLRGWLSGPKQSEAKVGFAPENLAPLDRHRVAVLPFANMSPNPQDDYFADGMTEELIATMSKIASLKVVARTSVMGYKGKKKRIDEIARELHAGSILDGSVRKSGHKVRITVQLIDSQKSDLLWAESYDREFKDVFEIQGDISKTVAETLEVRLHPRENATKEKQSTKNVEAHDLCLKGIYSHMEKYDPEKAVKYLERAVNIDPSYALAYAWLADSYSLLVTSGELSFDEGFPKAQKSASRALELDPNLPEAHTAMLTVNRNKLDFRGAETEARKALELNPNLAYAHDCLAYILRLFGRLRLDEALVEARKALELDPLGRFTNSVMAGLLYARREYDEAIEHLKKWREFDPDFKGTESPSYGGSSIQLGWCYLEKSRFNEAIQEFQSLRDPSKGKGDLNLSRLACAYARSGRREEAVRILDDFNEVSKNQFIPARNLILIHLALGDKEEAVRLMEKAYERKEYGALYWGLTTDPIFDGIRSDPRFKGLVHRLNLD